MRRFEVFAGCNHREMDTTVLEFPDGTPDDVCEAACADALDTLIGNCFYTGWNELEAERRPTSGGQENE